jgi:hypothetical protein
VRVNSEANFTKNPLRARGFSGDPKSKEIAHFGNFLCLFGVEALLPAIKGVFVNWLHKSISKYLCLNNSLQFRAYIVYLCAFADARQAIQPGQ